MTNEEKDSLLQSIYYDIEEGYDTIRSTYKKANAAIPSITLEYVKLWMATQKSRQAHKLRTWNSYVSHEPTCLFAVDIADFQKIADEKDEFKYLLLSIDTFTKYGYGVPMRGKDANEVTLAMKEI